MIKFGRQTAIITEFFWKSRKRWFQIPRVVEFILFYTNYINGTNLTKDKVASGFLLAQYFGVGT